MSAYTFELPADRGPKRCNIHSVTIRESNGDDEALASMTAEAKGKQGSVHIETVRASIVAVDGKPVSQPFLDFDKWNTRTRRIVSEYWSSINGTDTEELGNFIKAALPVPEVSRPALSVAGGSGEPG